MMLVAAKVTPANDETAPAVAWSTVSSYMMTPEMFSSILGENLAYLRHGSRFNKSDTIIIINHHAIDGS